LITPPKKAPQVKEEIEGEAPEGPVFTVKSIELIGVKTFKPEDFKPIVSKYENKEISVAELKIMCKEIERDYLRRGVIAACFLPPQDVKEGKVEVRVVEAKMGKLDVTGSKYFSKKRIGFYWRSKEGEVLRYDEISRSLQFMNKNPDRMAKAALHAGQIPETTDVLLDVTTNFPIHVTATADREGAISTGRYRKGLGLVHNNFLGLDDTLLGGYTGGKNFGGGYIYHRVPITNFGTSIMYGYNKTKSFPKKDYERFEISSMQEGFSVFVYQDLFQKDEYKGELSFGVDGTNKRVVGINGDLNVDRLRVLTGGLMLMGRGMGNVTTIKPAISQGVNFFGARRKNEYSSRDAENTFSKFNLNASMKQAYIKNFQASLKVTAQVASEKLAPQQELYIGGIDSVRGYPSGDYLADSGFYTQWELLIPAFFIPEKIKVPYGERPIKDEITGVVFFDYGYGEKRGLMEGEVAQRRMASAGAGVRFKLLNQAMLRLEWGWPLSPLVNYGLTEFSRSRFHFALDFQDDMPEEMERLEKVSKEAYAKEVAWIILNDEMHNPNSILCHRIYVDYTNAQKAFKEGKLEDAKMYYDRLISVAHAAFMQTETYLKENYSLIEQLKAENKKAAEYFEQGEVDKAREIWQGIKENAKLKPLVLDII